MDFSVELIEENKVKFIELVKSIKREGIETDKLLNKLENSDFYVAPASSKYHGAYAGGLVDHCLNVYFNLKRLVENKHLDVRYDDETLIIVALFHDFSKMNFYEKTAQNKKVYSPDGSKYDEIGKYDWVAVSSYKVIDTQDRFLYGNHEQTAEYMIRQFIPLKLDESIAILHHMGGMSIDSAKDDISSIYNKCPLALLLHLADMLATYIDERVYQ